MAAQNEQLDYFLNVVLRNYCRAAEENEILYDEMSDLRNTLSLLLRENADLRFRLTEVGVALPPSSFVSEEDLADIQ